MNLSPDRKLLFRPSAAPVVVSVFLALVPLLGHAARVIEATAIPFTGFLSKADFDQRYPGEEIADLSALDPGWYVIYEHEALTYYFGPVLLESTGQDYLVQLTKTVEAAVASRPSIEGYRLELSYEPKQNNSSASGAGSAEPPTSAGTAGSGSPQPTAEPGIWGFIKRIFGL